MSDQPSQQAQLLPGDRVVYVGSWKDWQGKTFTIEKKHAEELYSARRGNDPQVWWFYEAELAKVDG